MHENTGSGLGVQGKCPSVRQRKKTVYQGNCLGLHPKGQLSGWPWEASPSSCGSRKDKGEPQGGRILTTLAPSRPAEYCRRVQRPTSQPPRQVGQLQADCATARRVMGAGAAVLELPGTRARCWCRLRAGRRLLAHVRRRGCWRSRRCHDRRRWALVRARWHVTVSLATHERDHSSQDQHKRHGVDDGLSVPPAEIGAAALRLVRSLR